MRIDNSPDINVSSVKGSRQTDSNFVSNRSVGCEVYYIQVSTEQLSKACSDFICLWLLTICNILYLY